jgi:hypothetical protein
LWRSLRALGGRLCTQLAVSVPARSVGGLLAWRTFVLLFFRAVIEVSTLKPEQNFARRLEWLSPRLFAQI